MAMMMMMMELMTVHDDDDMIMMMMMMMMMMVVMVTMMVNICDDAYKGYGGSEESKVGLVCTYSPSTLLLILMLTNLIYGNKKGLI